MPVLPEYIWVDILVASFLSSFSTDRSCTDAVFSLQLLLPMPTYFVLFVSSAIVFHFYLCLCLVSLGPTLSQQTDFESSEAVRPHLLHYYSS